MIVERLMRKCPFQSRTFRTIGASVLAAVIVTATVLVVSQLLGLPAHPGVAGALGAVAGASCLARHQRK